MTYKMTVWAWYCGKPHGGYIFRGNPNVYLPPYHFDDINSLMSVGGLVYTKTRRGLIQYYDMDWWNKRFPQFRVKPVRVTVAMERVQKAKGGAK